MVDSELPFTITGQNVVGIEGKSWGKGVFCLMMEDNPDVETLNRTTMVTISEMFEMLVTDFKVNGQTFHHNGRTLQLLHPDSIES